MSALERLPVEVLLSVVGFLEPKDVVRLCSTSRFLNNFVSRHARALPRHGLCALELMGKPTDDGWNAKLIGLMLHLTVAVNGARRLWKTLHFDNKFFAKTYAPDVVRKVFLEEGATVRITGCGFSKDCLRTLTDFLESAIRFDYPRYRRTVDFHLHLTDCMFTRVQASDVTRFLNRMIDLGCQTLVFNEVCYEDFHKLCAALRHSRLHLLDVFRFHSSDITSARADPICSLFVPFCRLGRRTTRIVIDGIQVPLNICEWAMVEFCCTKFFNTPPPALRVVVSIHRNYSRQELFDLLGGVRSGVNEARSHLSHRLNHVYLELGMYESDVYLSHNQHCVIDVKLMKPKAKSSNK